MKVLACQVSWNSFYRGNESIYPCDYIKDGLDFLRANNQNVIIRNSGGLAVALDSGVLNLSLILSNDNKVSIHTGYDIMTSFIKDLLKDYTTNIEAYEIVGSYCPGDYDLSINVDKLGVEKTAEFIVEFINNKNKELTLN